MGAMKFGIFYEHQLPRPWAEDSEYRLLQNSLTQIELADKLGYGQYGGENRIRFDSAGYAPSHLRLLRLAGRAGKGIVLRLARGRAPDHSAGATGLSRASGGVR